jgi:hypothetical protein
VVFWAHFELVSTSHGKKTYVHNMMINKINVSVCKSNLTHIKWKKLGYRLRTSTPKHLRPFFGPFLKFGQAIVDAIFVQKISNFQ